MAASIVLAGGISLTRRLGIDAVCFQRHALIPDGMSWFAKFVTTDLTT